MKEANSSNKIIYRAENIYKNFSAVKALVGASFSLYESEIHALVGENGAGKSTMMKILSGVMKPDSGDLYLNGLKVSFKNIKDAEKHGIAIIHQELNFCQDLTVGENIFLSREFMKKGMVDRKKISRESKKILALLNSTIDPLVKVSRLSISQKQIVEIAKAISLDANIIIMDEPTSSLGEKEVEILFDIMNNLKARGKSIIYISHKLDEVQTIADRVTVFRDGAYILTDNISNITVADIVKAMVDRDLKDFFPSIETEKGECLLEVNNISYKDIVNEASFNLYKGEILGFSGLVGAGRTELMKTIIGEFSKSSGDIKIGNQSITIHSIKDSMSHGIVYLSEDRKGEGVLLELNVLFNSTLSSLKKMTRTFLQIIDEGKRKKFTRDMVNKLNIKTSENLMQKCGNLSGGNQQKVALAKLLLTKPRIMILDEPTRGIDVNAKVEIYNILNQLKKEGVGVVLISSELPEIVGMSDRVIVMNNGKIMGEVEKEDVTQETIMHLAFGSNEEVTNE